jgi:outer membrane protein assembly factor BamB
LRNRYGKIVNSNQSMNWLGPLKQMKEEKRTRLFKTTLLLVMSCLVGLVLLGCASVRGAVPRGWSGGTLTGNTLVIGSMDGELVAVNMTEGKRLWDATLESPEQSRGLFGCTPTSTVVAIYGSPAVDRNLIYIGGYNGIFYAFSPNKEEPRWVYPRQGTLRGNIIGGAVVSEGNVYFSSSDGRVYALDAAEGYKEEGWPFEIKDKVWSTPAIDGDTLFIGSFDKKLYAIDTTTAKEKWDRPFETEGAIVATPLVYKNTVYIGSFDRHLYAVDAASGKEKWRYRAGNWFWAKPVIYNNSIYVGCLDGWLYILNADNGDEINKLDLGSPISSSPVLAGDLVIIATEDGTVYGIDTKNNQAKWINGDLKEDEQQIYASLCASEGRVYIHTDKGELHVLNTNSGVEQWSLSLTGE